MKREVVVVEG
jgi:hypothetical protein